MEKNHFSHLSTYYSNKGTFIDFFFGSKGRINRLQFLLATIGHIFCFTLLGIMTFLLVENLEEIFLLLVFSIVVFMTVYSIYVINIKRLHDMNKSGWWSIITVGWAPFSTLFLLLIPGVKGENKYGPNI